MKIKPSELPALRGRVVSEMRASVKNTIKEYREAVKAGRFYCNDILAMVRVYRNGIRSTVKGECDHQFWLVQRMWFLKTGESVALLP